MRLLIFLVSCNIFIGLASGQTAARMIQLGNEEYRAGNYPAALEWYRKSAEKENNSYPLENQYNLACALYKSGNLQEARTIYSGLLQDPRASQEMKARIYHNLGNTYLTEKNFASAIPFFKQALKLDPTAEDTRYNLSYALKMLKKQQQEQNKDQNKDQQKDQNKDQQKDQNKDQQKDQNQDKQDSQNQDQQNENNQQQQSGMSRQQADQLLNALKTQEKRTQRELRRGSQVNGSSRPIKDW